VKLRSSSCSRSSSVPSKALKAIPEAMAMQAGQAMQHRNEPAHQIQSGLLNRQLDGAGGGKHAITSKRSSAAIMNASCAGNHGSAQRAGPE
jgi:hypothetical protein